MKTFVYIDGFNLYNRRVKGTAYKWLNLRALCERILKAHDVKEIKYFTAHVKARPGDPDQPVRQEIYLRALRTLPNFQIILGSFRQREKRLPIATRCSLAAPEGQKPKFIMVSKEEEKGSDVNLATHFILDGCGGKYELAVLISNDSDFSEPMRVVREVIKLKTGVISPVLVRHSVDLAHHSDFKWQIEKKDLKRSQFDESLRDEIGEFHKPEAWKPK